MHRSTLESRHLNGKKRQFCTGPECKFYWDAAKHVTHATPIQIQLGQIKDILHIWVIKSSSTVVKKTHCQLSQMVNDSCCRHLCSQPLIRLEKHKHYLNGKLCSICAAKIAFKHQIFIDNKVWRSCVKRQITVKCRDLFNEKSNLKQ